jgi:quinol monooxygenase YgiN
MTLIDGMAGPSRAEPGNLRWEAWQDRDDPNRVLLDEAYRDDAAAAAHHATEHYKAYAGQVRDLAERTVMSLVPRDLPQEAHSKAPASPRQETEP